MTFEESMKRLEAMSEKIKSGTVTLQEAIDCYHEGIKCYENCNKILSDAKQQIEVHEERLD